MYDAGISLFDVFTLGISRLIATYLIPDTVAVADNKTGYLIDKSHAPYFL